MFGEHSWRVRSEIGAIRRVIDVLARGSEALRELAIAWSDEQLARGVSTWSVARRWSTLSSLVAAIERHTARARGCAPAQLGTLPRAAVLELDARGVAAIVARAAADAKPRDAAILALLGEHGITDAHVVALRVVDALRIASTLSTPGAAALRSVCEGRPALGFVFDGRRRGRALSPRGVRMVA